MPHKKAKRRLKKAKKSGLDRGRRIQEEIDRLQEQLQGNTIARKSARGKVRNVLISARNILGKVKRRNSTLVDELSRQSLGRGRSTGTTLLGGQAKAPSIATTGTTLLRTS